MIEIEMISHCCFRIAFDDGTVVITDPWLNNINFLRSVPLPYHWKRITKCDMVAVSHNHLDHVDRSGLLMARRVGAQFIGSESAVSRARRNGLWNCISLEAGETFRFEDVRVTAVPTSHPMSPDGIGFLFDQGGQKVYFSGDTRLEPRIVEALQVLKPDIMIVQIRASIYLGRRNGMNVEDAAEMVREVGPAAAIPMHYHERTKTEDPEKFRAALSGDAAEVVILKPGESWRFLERV